MAAHLCDLVILKAYGNLTASIVILTPVPASGLTRVLALDGSGANYDIPIVTKPSSDAALAEMTGYLYLTPGLLGGNVL